MPIRLGAFIYTINMFQISYTDRNAIEISNKTTHFMINKLHIIYIHIGFILYQNI